MRVFISAGEPSGDLHGSNLARALHRQRPNVDLFGFGGDRMAAAGCELVYPLCKMAIMGFGPVLATLPKFVGLLTLADRWFLRHKPDALVLIDFPGFHWWLARRAKAHGIPVFYFVPPQIWAWMSWRVNKMRKYVDHVLCSLPFEEAWYRERGVEAQYIGHPYFDELRQQRLDPNFMLEQRRKGGHIIGLLPGSRTHEVEMNGRTMVRMAERLHRQFPDVRFLFACYKSQHRERLKELLSGRELPVELHVGRTPEIIELSQMCAAVSGSVSLELLHALKPSAIVYRMGPLMHAIIKRFVTCKYASLVNLLADRRLYPEFLSMDCRAEGIAEALAHWLTHRAERESLVAELRALRDQVAVPGACERAAGFILETLSGASPRSVARAA